MIAQVLIGNQNFHFIIIIKSKTDQAYILEKEKVWEWNDILVMNIQKFKQFIQNMPEGWHNFSSSESLRGKGITFLFTFVLVVS